MKPIIALTLVAMWLTGCEAVFVPEPVGDEVVKLEEARWQGTWINGEIAMVTTVMDADNGMLQAAWLERGKEGARMESISGQVRQTGERMYLSALDTPPEGESGETPPAQAAPRYFWMRVIPGEGQFTLWMPQLEPFRAEVRAGTLPGAVDEDGNVLLGKLTAEQLERINLPASNLLNWNEPLVFVRVGQ